MISRPDIEAAAGRINGHVRHTPVLRLEPGALGLDYGITLKLEHLQVTGSFKVRGAFNTLLSNDLTEAGVVAISGGNHGAAVACAATKLGVKSTVMVPETHANEVKLARMRGFGAEVIVPGGTINDAIAAYETFAKDTGALPVHPYDAPGTIAGQGTLGREIEEQAPDLDTVLVSVGGGGLVGGVAAWFGGRVKVVAVETELTSTLDRTLAGTLRDDFNPSGVAVSGLGASSIGKLPIDIIRAHVHENILVPDAAVYDAARRLWDGARLVGEPGAVVALAALTSGAYRPARGEKVGVLICGGNAEPGWFRG